MDSCLVLVQFILYTMKVDILSSAFNMDIFYAIKPYFYFSKLFGIANFQIRSISTDTNPYIKLVNGLLLFTAITIDIFTVAKYFGKIGRYPEKDSEIAATSILITVALKSTVSITCIIMSQVKKNKIAIIFKQFNHVHWKLLQWKISTRFKYYRCYSIIFLVMEIVILAFITLFYEIFTPGYYSSVSEVLSAHFITLSIVCCMGQFGLILCLLKNYYARINRLFR